METSSITSLVWGGAKIPGLLVSSPKGTSKKEEKESQEVVMGVEKEENVVEEEKR